MAKLPRMKGLDTLSGMGSGHRPYGPGGIVIEAFAVSNSLQGLIDSDIMQGHGEGAIYTVIDDEIDMTRPCQTLKDGPNRNVPHLNINGNCLKRQKATDRCRPGFGIKIHDTSFLPITSEFPKGFRRA